LQYQKNNKKSKKNFAMKVNAFENQIFHHYRENEKKTKKAIEFLRKNGYVVYKERKLS
jgi:hypothetical protein